MTNLKPYEFRDPAALMSEIAEQVSLDEGCAHLVLVDHPATTQRIVRIDRLGTPAEIFEYDAACEEMREVVDSWPVPDVRPPRHASVLVVVRPGWCVFGPNEMQWCLASRYLNPLASIYTGDVVLVTEHGWLDLMTHFAGPEPAMRSAA
ncbi:MAG: hypothetical protein JWP82_2390 [Humibacillus sp.]|nr:hypothetical protein [Humibacillus sp.]